MGPELLVLIGIIINTTGLITVGILNYKISKNIEEVKHATNSMKDALVAGAHREGEQSGKDKQIAIQKEIKEGIKNAV